MADGSFVKSLLILTDTRERENSHILDALDTMGVRHETRKRDIGDYGFCVGDKDFSAAFAIERKSGLDELYTNIMEKPPRGEMNRLEKELCAAKQTLVQLYMIVEGIASWDELKAYTVPAWQMKASPQRQIAEIGKPCYNRLRAWQAANRYGLSVEFVPDKTKTAERIVELCYYYYHNYKALIAPRRT